MIPSLSAVASARRRATGAGPVVGSPFPSSLPLNASGTHWNDGFAKLGLYMAIQALRSDLRITGVRYFQMVAGASTRTGQPRLYNEAGSAQLTPGTTSYDLANTAGVETWATMLFDTPYLPALNQKLWFGFYLTDYARYVESTSVSFASPKTNGEFTTWERSSGKPSQYNYGSDTFGDAEVSGASSAWYGMDIVYERAT